TRAARSTGGSVTVARCMTPRSTNEENELRHRVQRGVVASCNASYARTRAPPVYDTDLASGPPRDAHPPPVEDQRVREPGPLVARHQPHQVSLDFHGIRLTCEAEQGGQALHVCVHHDPFVLPEPGAEYHVRGLAADA